MEPLEAGGLRCRIYPGPGTAAPTHLYLIDDTDRPWDPPAIAPGLVSTVICLEIPLWGNALTPWPAPSPFKGSDPFGGRGSETLGVLVESVIPAIEGHLGEEPRHRSVAGYSLGGLFALDAFLGADAFDGAASMSGSLWYPGWIEHLRETEGRDRDLTGLPVHLSLGRKERRAGPATLKTVQERTEEAATLLERQGCRVELRLWDGGHFHHPERRVAAGLRFLDRALR